MLDRFPVTVEDFKGINLKGVDNFSPASVATKINIDEASVQNNLIVMDGGDLTTRLGFEKFIDCSDLSPSFTISGHARQFWQIGNLNGETQEDRYLILSYHSTSGNGYIYDTGSDGVATTNPILTISGMKYAFVLNAFGRMYISPWEASLTPLTSENVYVYNGDYNARLTGVADVLPLGFAAAVAAGGNMTIGLHLCLFLYETDSGYIGRFPSNTLTSFTTTAANRTVNFTGIPVGAAGTGVVKRHIAITKIVINNNSQGFDSYEPFYAVTINNNTATTASFNKPDSALVESAKDRLRSLNDETIPACVSMSTYGSRLVYNGLGLVASRGDLAGASLRNLVVFSEPNNPEKVFKPDLGDSNSVLVGPEANGPVTCGAEINKTYYIFKTDSTWAINETVNLSPIEWEAPTSVDSGKGAFPFSISSVGDNNLNLINDGIIVIGLQGISFFNGRHVSMDLTDKIWPNVLTKDKTYLEFAQVLIEPIRKYAFWRFGDPASDFSGECYALNYRRGFTADQVRISSFTMDEVGDYDTETIDGDFRWIGLRSGWTDGTVSPTGIFDVNHYLLMWLHSAGSVSTTGNKTKIFSEALVKADGENTADANTANAVYYALTSGYSPNKGGEIYSFSGLKVRAVSIWDSNITLPSALLNGGLMTAQYGKLDSSNVQIADDINFYNSDPTKTGVGIYETRKLNANSEQIRISLFGYGKIFIQKFVLFGVAKAQDRPR